MSKILNYIKQAFYSLVDADNDDYPSGQSTSNGKSEKFIRLGTYGICSNPPLNSHIVLISSQGQESIKFGIINDFKNRMKSLKEGEVVIMNTITNTYIYLLTDGSIEISGTTNIIGDLNITGDLDVSGDITTNDITADNVTASTDVIANGVSLKNHVHGGVTTGTSSTLPPT